jgi:hypothetical protein
MSEPLAVCRACGADCGDKHRRGCVYSHSGRDERVQDIHTKIDPITEAILGQPPFCPDGAACHHECKGRDCFRVRCCEPLSDVYKDDEWPEALLCHFN